MVSRPNISRQEEEEEVEEIWFAFWVWLFLVPVLNGFPLVWAWNIVQEDRGCWAAGLPLQLRSHAQIVVELEKGPFHWFMREIRVEPGG